MHLLDTIGRTALIRLQRLEPAATGAQIWVKRESVNPGGSVKDRIALAMIQGAEQRGQLGPGALLVEPTSGNTGIGLAWICALRGLRLTLTMPESMSLERRALLQAYGAELLLTPAAQGMKGAVAAAERLVDERGAVYLNQFANPDNPAAHYATTGPEILQACTGQLDTFVAGVGTGGTISGVGRYLHEHVPGVRIVAVEPSESPVLSGGKPGPHAIQGIGAGFVPAALDRSVIDEILTVDGAEALAMARRLFKEEGLACGISSGANVAAALRLAARPEYAGKRLVTVLPDGAERYMSTALFGVAV